MKKLFLGLFFVLCAFQVNAATFTLYADDATTVVDSGPYVGNGVSISGVTGDTGSYTWYIEVDPTTSALVINGGSPSSGVDLTSVEIRDDTNTLVASNYATTHEYDLSVLLNTGVKYSVALAYEFTRNVTGTIDINVSQVPVPAAVWLFGSALMGLVGFSKRKSGGMLSA